MKYLLLFVLLAAAPLAAVAAKPEARQPKKDAAAEETLTEEEADARAYEEQLDFRRGRVELPGGIAVLNVPEGFRYLPAAVEAGIKQVLRFAEFVPGQRYSDFNADTDHLAAYGLGALVAGKLAATAGFFKLALAALLGAKKLVIVAVVGLGALLLKLFRRKGE